MDYEQKQREAFYLTKKYASLTWYEEIFSLWTKFCVGHEEMLRHPEIHLLGQPVTEWWEHNFRIFWAHAGEMEEGLELIRQGNKNLGFELAGSNFATWLYSRRFEEMDLSELGYRRYKSLGVSTGIFADAEKANDMANAGAIFRHTDRLRRDYVSLPNHFDEKYAVPIAAILKTPYGVPPGELPPLPALDPNAPSIMSGDEVPCMGIWVVEPDAAHQGQTYCMAYLAQWAPAIDTVSEQEYEKNTRWSRTDDEAYRIDYNKIKDYPVRWRLLWRDDRDYSNGNYPPEEADYLIYRGESVATPQVAIRLRCDAGQACPQSGKWFTPANGGVVRDFVQGDIFPDFKSYWGSTIWQLDQADD